MSGILVPSHWRIRQTFGSSGIIPLSSLTMSPNEERATVANWCILAKALTALDARDVQDSSIC